MDETAACGRGVLLVDEASDDTAAYERGVSLVDEASDDTAAYERGVSLVDEGSNDIAAREPTRRDAIRAGPPPPRPEPQAGAGSRSLWAVARPSPCTAVPQPRTPPRCCDCSSSRCTRTHVAPAARERQVGGTGGVGFRAWGLRVLGYAGLRVCGFWGLGFGVWIWGLRFGVWGFGALSLGFRSLGLVLRG